jgi:hypothetical protein
MVGNIQLWRSQLRLGHFVLAQDTGTKEGILILYQRAELWSSRLSLQGVSDNIEGPLLAIPCIHEICRAVQICIRRSSAFA